MPSHIAADRERSGRPPVLLFDVNETLLDLAALDPVFRSAFGSTAVRGEWFTEMLQIALTTTITGRYADFSACQEAALAVVGERHGVAADFAPLRRGMVELPPHPEVPAALDRLRDAGFRLATLTNSTAEAGEAQLRYAGIRDRFELALSADAVHRLKPAAEPYRYAADALGVPVAEIVLVAAHSWDVSGAAAAGCSTAFVARAGKVRSPLAPPPLACGADLDEVADRLLSLRPTRLAGPA